MFASTRLLLSSRYMITANNANWMLQTNRFGVSNLKLQTQQLSAKHIHGYPTQDGDASRYAKNHTLNDVTDSMSVHTKRKLLRQLLDEMETTIVAETDGSINALREALRSDCKASHKERSVSDITKAIQYQSTTANSTLHPTVDRTSKTTKNSFDTLQLETEMKHISNISSDVSSDAAPEHQTKQADIIFNWMDSNCDGQVSKKEFCTWYNYDRKRDGRTINYEATHYDNKNTQQSTDSAGNAIKETNEMSASSTCGTVGQKAADEEMQRLKTSQICIILLKSSIPFIGFGFMDNCLMLFCGEVIDRYAGVIIGLSTLAAAGLGNTISCTIGVVTGGFVERIVSKFGLPSANLTSYQRESAYVKNLRITGSVLGICIGCLLGMFPLLLMPDRGTCYKGWTEVKEV